MLPALTRTARGTTLNRTGLLAAIGPLALLLAACGGSPASESSAASEDQAPSIAATPEPAPSDGSEPSEAAAPSEDSGSGSSGTPLADLLPDSLGGEAREDLDLDDQMIAALLAGQDVEVGDVEFLISTYGDSGIGVTAIRIPDLPQANMEMIARAMAGMPQTQGEIETIDLGGKSVIAIESGVDGVTGYMYLSGDAVFVIGGGNEDQAAEILEQLP
jgi:hypothetical protein